MTTFVAVPALREFFARVSRRITWIAAAEGAAVGFGIALLALLIGLPGAGSAMRVAGVGLSLAVVGLALRIVMTRRAPVGVALLVERHAPECRNIVVTAMELIDEPSRVRPYVGDVVCNQAATAIRALDPAALFPARRALSALGASGGAWALAAAFIPGPLISPDSAARADARAAINSIEIVVTPPAYAARREETLRDPARIVALAGSRVRVTVRANASAVAIETIGGRHALAPGDSRTFSGEVLADGDGYIAIEAVADSAQASVRRLIGLTVTPDLPPRVRVSVPGRDVTYPDPRRTLDVTVDADDDLALATLRLRYTKVSGSGERFTFTEGDAPLAVTRESDRTWKGRGALRLDTLKLAPGDLVVYRAIAADRRPGAVPSESDTYIVEISAPGAMAAGGFAADDQRDRYGISQQMVILKTERLITRQASLSPDSLVHEALMLAAEQRAVRAEFVFMMGGELAEEVLAAAGLTELNEVAEAEAEDDIAAGRLANRGRLDLVRAIRSMSRANAALTATNLAQALKDERAALTYLQGAFARARYILRALTERERLDLSRRLSGVLSAVTRDVRPTTESTADPRVVALRGALSGIATIAGGDAFAEDAGPQALRLAERVLTVDPSATGLQQVASQLTQASQAIGNGRAAQARTLLDRAATELAAAVRASLLQSPHRNVTLTGGRLEGALIDALRHPGGTR